jgi:uncharacterized protein YdeI (YjbR/CyaY-like superfamily)
MPKDMPRKNRGNGEAAVSSGPKGAMVPSAAFLAALENDIEAKLIFNRLSRQKRHEIIEYISRSETKEGVDRNIKKAMSFLLGRCGFDDWDKP